MMDFDIPVATNETVVREEEKKREIETYPDLEALHKKEMEKKYPKGIQKIPAPESIKKKEDDYYNSKQAVEYRKVKEQLQVATKEKLRTAVALAVGYRIYLVYSNTGSRPSELLRDEISTRLIRGSLDNPKTLLTRVVHESCSKDSFSLTLEYFYDAELRNILDIIVNYTRSIEDAKLVSIMSGLNSIGMPSIER